MIYGLKRHPSCALMIAGFAMFGAAVKAVIFAAELEMWFPPISPGKIEVLAAAIGPGPIRNVAVALGLIGLGFFVYGVRRAVAAR